jgi:SlyX protein
MSDEAAERLHRIEATIAHLEHQVEQLNGVIIEQGKDLEQVKRLVQRQAQTLETIELERVKATNAKPPHYGP